MDRPTGCRKGRTMKTTLNAIRSQDDPVWCLRDVTGHDREIRLYAVWCARRVQRLMRDPRSLAALDVAERFANGQATDAELKIVRDAAIVIANSAWLACGIDWYAREVEVSAALAAARASAEAASAAAAAAGKSAEAFKPSAGKDALAAARYAASAAGSSAGPNQSDIFAAEDAERAAQFAELRRICEVAA